MAQVQLCRPVVHGGAVGAMAPPYFGRSVNPISTRGSRLCPTNDTGTPGFSDLPTALGYDLDTHALYVYHHLVTEKAVATLILQIILLLSTSHTMYLDVDLHTTTCSSCRNVHEKNLSFPLDSGNQVIDILEFNKVVKK